MRVSYRALSLLLVLTSAAALPDLGNFFQSLYKSQPDDHLRVNSAHERVKRQDTNIGDESQLPYLITSSSIPTLSDKKTPNTRYMPTLGNGYIGVTVYDNAMYLNGLYNGAAGESHRAQIPAMTMSRVELANEDLESRATRKFWLNAQDGYYMETIDCEFAYIEHRIYVHQKYIRLVVSDIFARRKDGAPGGGGIIRLRYPMINSTQDINFGQQTPHYSDWQSSGQTRVTEEGTSPQTIYVFWMDQLKEISLRAKSTVNETIIMSVDKHESNARSEFDYAVNLISDSSGQGGYKLLREHMETWWKVWSQGEVTVEGDVQVSKITKFSQFYLLSSLPARFANLPPPRNDFFYGAGRNSLSKGGLNKDHQGHIYWDSEMYILPAVLMFHPQLAKEILRYRSEQAPRAQEIANRMGLEGYKYPWESAYSGAEVSPATCSPACEDRKIHVSAAIGFAIRQYYSATRDRDYQINSEYNACDVMREIARFLASKATYNSVEARYDMKNITGPDENYPNVHNNAYTMVASSLAIHWARYFACTCQRNERQEVPDEWIEKALYMNLPFDNVRRLHYEFENFDKVKQPRVAQADTILLSYPLNWNMSTDIMRNDLEYYELLTNDRSPAMTWSFYTVGWKWVNEESKISSYFLKSYQDYVIQPFRVWTEFNEQNEADQQVGSVNFLPGMGGFLQSLIYGFAGLRVRPEQLEFHNPIPPPGCDRIFLRGFKYLGANMTLEVSQSQVQLTVHDVAEHDLVLRRNDTYSVEESLTPGSVVTLENPRSGFYIYSNTRTGCEHPRDYIYMPWGYSPWVDAAGEFSASRTVLVTCLLLLALVDRTIRCWL